MKFILDEAILREDDAVFDLENEVVFPRGVESNRPVEDILGSELKEWDITDKTDVLKAWLQRVEEDIVNQNYSISSIDLFAFEDEFITEVLGFHPFGPEVHYNLADFGVELKFKTGIDNTSGVFPPIPSSPSRERREKKHIIHKTMPKATLIGWSKLYIKRIASLLVNQLLMAGVHAEVINEAIDHLWLFEHIDSVENITKYLRKISLDYKFAKNHKEFDKVKAIKDQLTKLLDGTEWELVCCHEGGTQKNIVKGSGLSQSLLDWLEEPDLYINKFIITDSDI